MKTHTNWNFFQKPKKLKKSPNILENSVKFRKLPEFLLNFNL